MCGSMPNATSLSPYIITFIPHLMVSADNARLLPNYCLMTETSLHRFNYESLILQIWHVEIQGTGAVKVEFAADLQRHQKAVNVVRFSPSGEFLASADDGKMFC
jgi:hypothetical protein